MAKKPLPEKYVYWDWSDTYHDDDMYFFWHQASPWKRKMLLRAAWKEDAPARGMERREGREGEGSGSIMMHTDHFDDSQPLGVLGWYAEVARRAGDDREWRRLAKKYGEHELIVAVTETVRGALDQQRLSYAVRP